MSSISGIRGEGFKWPGRDYAGVCLSSLWFAPSGPVALRPEIFHRIDSNALENRSLLYRGRQVTDRRYFATVSLEHLEARPRSIPAALPSRVLCR